MRWLVASGLIVLIAHGAVRADPSAPQVGPLPGHREDAQRLREQLRGLDGVPLPSVSIPPAGAAATTVPGAASPDPPDSSSHKVAVALLTVAGVTGVATLGFVIGGSSGPSSSTYDDVETVLGVTAGVTAALGLFTLVRSQSVQVAPTVTPKAVGLAISGRL
jgi:hypothetical protein